MSAEENRAAVERLWQRMSAGEFASIDEAMREDAVQEWPQSGERIRGRANIRAVNENYPGFPTADVRRIIAAGDLVISEVALDYGGQKYFGVSIFEFEDGKIVRETDYFAEPFDAPQWRARWVERM